MHALIVLSVLRRLEVREVDIMGLSWGGLLAQQIAIMTPLRTRRVVLLSTNVGLGSRAGSWRATKTLLTQRRYKSADGMAVAVNTFGGDTNRIARADHPHTLARLARPPTTRGYYSQLVGVLGWSSPPWLWLISQPTLVVSGEDDLAVPPINARRLAKLIRHSQLEIVSGAGHLFAVERPRQAADLVVRFLSPASP
jgi:poly(3-hydroxyoctanoate) depolymerase